ncbi:MAG TPA: hypothetical protein VD971_04510 [Phycisphaerales bacterium]|nr:hypothetical protein [Phycisphaerales bacterium]
MRLTIAAIVVGAAASIACADVTFNDSVFPNSNWGFETAVQGTGSGSGTQSATIGNPAASRLVTVSVGAGSVAWSVSRFGTTQGTRYDPVTQGAIASIDFTIDYAYQSGVGGQGQALQFIIKQGATVYAAAYTVTGSTGAWGTHTALSLTASDFTPILGGTAHPDFSTSGEFIRVGFAVGNSSTGGGYTTVGAFDNFSAAIHVVPAPGALALAGLGGLLAGRRKR